MIKTVEKNNIIADFQRGLGNKAIAKAHGHSRTTIIGFRKAYNEAIASDNPDAALTELIRKERVPSKRKRKHTKLTDAIKAIIDADLDENKVKMATGRRKMVKLGTDIYEDVLRAGHKVSYRTVRRYIETKEGSRPATVLNCFIRQAYVPGERMEFDWGEVKIFISGVQTTLNMGVMSMGSNARWARLSTKQDKLAMMEAHVNGFDFFGATPQVMVYDNMRTAVMAFASDGKKPTLELTQLEAYYGFVHLFCNVCSGNEKPHVERSVDVVRRKAFGVRDRFCSIEEANEYLLQWCRENNESVKEAFEEELRYMRPVSTPFACFEGAWRHVTKEALISMDTNEYSVPYSYVNKDIWVRKYSDKVDIYDNDGDNPKMIASHVRLHGREQQSIDIQHYLAVLKVKPGALKHSVALKQTPESLQSLYHRHFENKSRDFVEMLLWASEKGISYQELCSSALLAQTKGVKTVTFDVIKSVIAEYAAIMEAVDMPWSKGIEDGSQANLDMLGSMFNSSNAMMS